MENLNDRVIVCMSNQKDGGFPAPYITIGELMPQFKSILLNYGRMKEFIEDIKNSGCEPNWCGIKNKSCNSCEARDLLKSINEGGK